MESDVEKVLRELEACVGDYPPKEMLLGIIDVLCGSIASLTRSGIVDRTDIVAIMDRVMQQQRTMDTPSLPGRQFAAKIIRTLSSADLKSGLRAIDGGKTDPDKPPSVT